jgi:hypothetical protein
LLGPTFSLLLVDVEAEECYEGRLIRITVLVIAGWRHSPRVGHGVSAGVGVWRGPRLIAAFGRARIICAQVRSGPSAPPGVSRT